MATAEAGEDHGETDARLPRAAVSFTGGKDCHLALYRASKEYKIVCLVVFHPKDKKFRAHPIEWQRTQAQALGLPLHMYCTDASSTGGCYRKAYAKAIRQLQHEHQIEALITGDIDLIGDAKSNFISDVCAEYVPEIQVVLPLWQQPRRILLEEMSKTMEIIFSCVKSPFDSSWIGRRLLHPDDLQQFEAIDLTGENGEYHTMVLYAPTMYKHRLKLVNLEVVELTNQPGQLHDQQWYVCGPNTLLQMVQEDDT